MDIIDRFGKIVEDLSESDPARARAALRFGWGFQRWRFALFPEKRLLPADRYLAVFMMDAMRRPLRDPDNSVMVSIFTPCEIIQEAGLAPYNVEGFSNYISASRADGPFLREAEAEGISETLCSYHSLICDANMLTFKYLAGHYGVPSFFIDVPMGQTEENVRIVAEQLRDLRSFIEEQTGRRIDEEGIKERVRRSLRTTGMYGSFLKKQAGKYRPTDLVTPLYSAITNNILLGTEEQERYVKMLLGCVDDLEEKKGKKIYWMHTIPYWSEAVKAQMLFNERAQIIACELAQTCDDGFDPERPYEAMARRLIYSCYNNGADRRIMKGIRHAKEAGADGVIWFDHWGCKHTLGASRLAKKRFEEAGLPLLILEGDGCDRSAGGEGQTATRLEAFLEMLEAEDG